MMIYEYTITCLKCGYRVASGNFSSQVSLSDSDVMNKAEHNPSCAVPSNRDASRIRIEDSITTQGDATISNYTIHYRNI